MAETVLMTAFTPFRTVRPAVALVLACLAQPAHALEEDAIGWWIYVGSIRSTLASRYLGPEGVTPTIAAATQAARGCHIPLVVDRLTSFRESPIGAEPLVFGPWLERERVARALACVRRYVPGAVVVQALPPE